MTAAPQPVLVALTQAGPPGVGAAQPDATYVGMGVAPLLRSRSAA